MTNAPRPDSDDAYWRRPADGGASPHRVAPAAPAEPAAPRYEGPPASVPPPPGWQPPVVVPVTPPREMPRQDGDRMDAEEKAARTVSYGVGLVAAAVVLVLLVVVCARLVG
ncbi:translation initiation factor 2 [Actinocatenispora rupis]|uniref:translation initiation factor 2 n=1 Tax=Actinocatenispora rupis TaxID=519421 RepID=UPI0019440F65|nr:translation initiation factor 2 [Actinocatenispora rupis]